MAKRETKPDSRLALAYVIAQAIILLLLIFTNISFGVSILKLAWLGIILEALGVIGILLSADSIRTSLTALPLPKEHGRLLTSGLYRYMRHPVYTSILVFALGLAISGGGPYEYLLFIGLTILFAYKSKYEEFYLAKKYAGYQQYANKTPKFVPLLKQKKTIK
ncbi:isoprenylcysteine carboxylmethyltransferase family protein [Patescibacteria group bacterium]|nr:isoprenylcysteine carboxylmethyltransferase family protein [Patescibacteria group bacterium]